MKRQTVASSLPLLALAVLLHLSLAASQQQHVQLPIASLKFAEADACKHCPLVSSSSPPKHLNSPVGSLLSRSVNELLAVTGNNEQQVQQFGSRSLVERLRSLSSVGLPQPPPSPDVSIVKSRQATTDLHQGIVNRASNDEDGEARSARLTLARRVLIDSATSIGQLKSAVANNKRRRSVGRADWTMRTTTTASSTNGNQNELTSNLDKSKTKSHWHFSVARPVLDPNSLFSFDNNNNDDDNQFDEISRHFSPNLNSTATTTISSSAPQPTASFLSTTIPTTTTTTTTNTISPLQQPTKQQQQQQQPQPQMRRLQIKAFNSNVDWRHAITASMLPLVWPTLKAALDSSTGVESREPTSVLLASSSSPTPTTQTTPTTITTTTTTTSTTGVVEDKQQYQRQKLATGEPSKTFITGHPISNNKKTSVSSQDDKLLTIESKVAINKRNKQSKVTTKPKSGDSTKIANTYRMPKVKLAEKLLLADPRAELQQSKPQIPIPIVALIEANLKNKQQQQQHNNNNAYKEANKFFNYEIVRNNNNNTTDVSSMSMKVSSFKSDKSAAQEQFDKNKRKALNYVYQTNSTNLPDITIEDQRQQNKDIESKLESSADLLFQTTKQQQHQQQQQQSIIVATNNAIKSLFQFNRKPDTNKLPFFKRPLNFTENGELIEVVLDMNGGSDQDNVNNDSDAVDGKHDYEDEQESSNTRNGKSNINDGDDIDDNDDNSSSSSIRDNKSETSNRDNTKQTKMLVKSVSSDIKLAELQRNEALAMLREMPEIAASGKRKRRARGQQLEKLLAELSGTKVSYKSDDGKDIESQVANKREDNSSKAASELTAIAGDQLVGKQDDDKSSTTDHSTTRKRPQDKKDDNNKERRKNKRKRKKKKKKGNKTESQQRKGKADSEALVPVLRPKSGELLIVKTPKPMFAAFMNGKMARQNNSTIINNNSPVALQTGDVMVSDSSAFAETTSLKQQQQQQQPVISATDTATSANLEQLDLFGTHRSRLLLVPSSLMTQSGSQLVPLFASPATNNQLIANADNDLVWRSKQQHLPTVTGESVSGDSSQVARNGIRGLLLKPLRPAKYSLNGYIPKPSLPEEGNESFSSINSSADAVKQTMDKRANNYANLNSSKQQNRNQAKQTTTTTTQEFNFAHRKGLSPDNNNSTPTNLKEDNDKADDDDNVDNNNNNNNNNSNENYSKERGAGILDSRKNRHPRASSGKILDESKQTKNTTIKTTTTTTTGAKQIAGQTATTSLPQEPNKHQLDDNKRRYLAQMAAKEKEDLIRRQVNAKHSLQVRKTIKAQLDLISP